MKTVYLVRHGESTENVRTDATFRNHHADLTDTGRQQAETIAERAARLPLDVIIASTMVRAQDTAEAIRAATGLPMESSELFVERIVASSLVGGAWADPEFVKRFRSWEATFFSDASYEDGENFSAICARGQEALAYLAARPESDILVVTHGFFLRIILGLVLLQERFEAEDMRKLFTTVKTRNTGITVLRYDAEDLRGAWQMLTWNDHAHLG